MSNDTVVPRKMSVKVLRACLYLFAIYVGLFSLVWGVSSPLVTSQLNKHLIPYKLTLSAQSQVQFNPFVARLSIKQLELTHEDNSRVLKIGRAVVDVNVFSLFSKKIAFDDFQLSDAVIKVVKGSDSLSIIGIPLVNNSNSTNDSPDETSETLEPNNWQIVLANPKINNVVVDLWEGAIHHPLELTDANLADLVLAQNTQQLEFLSNYRYHDTKVTIDISSVLQNAFGKVSYSISVNNLNLTDFNSYLGGHGKFAGGVAKVTLNGDVQIAKEGIDLNVNKFNLNTTDVEFQHDEVNISIHGFDIETHSLFLQLAGEELSTQTKFALEFERVQVTQPKTEHLIASFDNLVSDDISITLEKSDISASYEKLIIDKLVFSEKNSPSNPTESFTSLVTLNQLVLNKAHFTQDLITLERVFLDRLKLNLFINENKQLTNLITLGNDTNLPPKTETSDEVTNVVDSIDTGEAMEETKAFGIRIGNIEIAQGSQIDINDESVSPAFEQTLVINKAQLSNLNTANNSVFTTLVLDTDIGKHANIRVSTDIQPFSPKLNMVSEIQLTELSLPRISSYMGKSLGLEFLSGQLDSDIKLNVTEDVLDGNALVNLRGLELVGTSHEQGNVVQESGMVPLNVALNMLKDNDDNVELNIPLSGNVNDPSFGVQSFVGLVAKKAIMSATESYLMQTFVPYSNIVSVARIAGEYMLRVTVDDLIYEPESVELSAQQLGFVENLVALLEEYPKKQLKVCAISVPADIEAELTITQEEKLALVELANERGQLFKNSLVETYGVGSKRLLLCKPKIDTKKGGKPRIEFKL